MVIVSFIPLLTHPSWFITSFLVIVSKMSCCAKGHSLVKQILAIEAMVVSSSSKRSRSSTGTSKQKDKPMDG